ncbi:MAG TPA: tetratricopeptide repeat protein, partial [Urbifossiella sp.]
VHRQPRSGHAWGELSYVLIANQLPEPALPCLAEAQKLEPDQACWPYLYGSVSLMLSMPREAIPKLREAVALARSTEDRQAALFLLAQTLIEDGQLSEAETHLEALGKLDPGDPRLFFGLGMLAFARDDQETARNYLTRVADHPSSRKQVCGLLATLTSSDPKLAQSYRARATQLTADLPWAASFDTVVEQYRVTTTDSMRRYTDLVAAGRKEEALDHLRAAAEQNPDEKICFNLGFALIQNGEIEEAEKSLRRALSFNPRHMRTNLFLGAALVELGDKRAATPGGKKEAQEMFRQAVHFEEQVLELQSDFALPYFLLGRAYQRLGRADDARKALRQAVLLGPDLVEAHQTLGEMLAEEGKIPEALEHLENAVRVAPAGDSRPRQALDKWKAKAKSP